MMFVFKEALLGMQPNLVLTKFFEALQSNSTILEIAMILKNKAFLMSLLMVGASSMPAWASKTITSPYVTKGKAEIEMKSGYALDDKSGDDAWEVKTSASYGVTDWWEAEAGVAIEDEGDNEGAELSAIFFESKFQLAKPGEFFVDPGIKVEYGHSLNSNADEIEAKFILAKQIGKFNNLANFSIGREVGDDASDETGYGFSYGVSYDMAEDFALGLEWYSDFGNFDDDFDDQGHQFGPVIYGDTPFGLEYEAGVLAGVSESAPDALTKLVLAYEF